MGSYKVGIVVNLEVDVIVCYLEWLMLGDKVVELKSKGIDMVFFVENGFLRK